MGKKSKSKSASDTQAPVEGNIAVLGGSATLDPALSSLFEKSAGPVKAPAVKYVPTAFPSKSSDRLKKPEDNNIQESEDQSAGSDDEAMEDAIEDSEADFPEEPSSKLKSRKRKRGRVEEDLEESFENRVFRRMREEEREFDMRNRGEERGLGQSRRQQQTDDEADKASPGAEEAESEDNEKEGRASPVPIHESLIRPASSDEVEKSNRTVFLGNVSTEAIKSKSGKKTLLRHLASFCSTLPESSGPHKVESIRFRSVPFSSGGDIPKRASFAKREILDETTPSTNAYAVYTTVQAARKAPAALNGTMVLDRHLRVDSIAHPAEIDHKRCVFVGNLDFVDQEGPGDDASGKKKKVRAPADIEEGLWRTFNEHTGDSKGKKTAQKSVEFVRVIRDRATRVGKGFAYVQFYDGNAVEEALLLNEKKFPPFLPRKLRVTRARKMLKKREEYGGRDAAEKTLQGRAGKLLGRAGAAKVKADSKGSIAGNSFVFEGHRATENGPSRLKVKPKSRGSKGKPKNRSSKRAAAYRAAGGQKP